MATDPPPFPDEHIMRYVAGQFDFLARLVEMGGEVCERVTTAGGGSICRRHGWGWTDSQPCPNSYQIGRAELVTHLRSLRSELEEFLSLSAGSDTAGSCADADPAQRPLRPKSSQGNA